MQRDRLPRLRKLHTTDTKEPRKTSSIWNNEPEWVNSDWTPWMLDDDNDETSD
jgi:hypothetical protein